MKRNLLITLTFVAILAVAVPTFAQKPADDPVKETRADMKATLGLIPTFMDAFPPEALPGAWKAFKAVQLSPDTALPGKTKELIGLGVAAQIPCTYCIRAHTAAARANGASDREIREAVAMAALTRHWSTVLNGSLLDEGEFRKWADAQWPTEEGGPEAGPPPFLDSYPATAVDAALDELMSMSGKTALSGKAKELIGLGVAAQIPCQYCVYAHTRGARAAGASQQEIQECLAMAALTRHWSTWLNGMQFDEAQFDKEFAAIMSAGEEGKGK